MNILYLLFTWQTLTSNGVLFCNFLSLSWILVVARVETTTLCYLNLDLQPLLTGSKRGPYRTILTPQLSASMRKTSWNVSWWRCQEELGQLLRANASQLLLKVLPIPEQVLDRSLRMLYLQGSRLARRLSQKKRPGRRKSKYCLS